MTDLITSEEVATKPPLSLETEETEEEDVEERLAKSRERNREHARRTRLRKKAHLQALQAKVKELQDESRVLKQSIEECSIASILLGLSSSPGKDQQTSSSTDTSEVDNFLTSEAGTRPSAENISIPITSRKRKKFIIDDPSAPTLPPPQLKFKIGGQSTVLGGGGKTHINWKSGVFCDENGEQKQLTPEELEMLRRERNRMHAKMTRDRKKIFISSVERTIAQLEQENQKMREILIRQVQQSSVVTPTARLIMPNTPPHHMLPNIARPTLTVPMVGPPSAPFLQSMKLLHLPATSQKSPPNTSTPQSTENADSKNPNSFTVVG